MEWSELIRRGGAPPGAAAYIIIGGMGVSKPHYAVSKESGFQKEIPRSVLMLFCGFAPAAHAIWLLWGSTASFSEKTALEKRVCTNAFHTGPMKIGKEIRIFTRAPPPQGPSWGGAVRFFLQRAVVDPPRGALRGGGTCHNRGYGGLNPHYPVPKNPVFIGNPSHNYVFFRASPPPLWHRRIAITLHEPVSSA